MNNKIKCLEYYFDSKICDESDITKNIEMKKREFPKKKIRVSVTLNEYGTYIVRFEFLNNQIAIFKHKTKKVTKKIYGQYKETKKYAPI